MKQKENVPWPTECHPWQPGKLTCRRVRSNLGCIWHNMGILTARQGRPNGLPWKGHHLNLDTPEKNRGSLRKRAHAGPRVARLKHHGACVHVIFHDGTNDRLGCRHVGSVRLSAKQKTTDKPIQSLLISQYLHVVSKCAGSTWPVSHASAARRRAKATSTSASEAEPVPSTLGTRVVHRQWKHAARWPNLE